MNTMTNTLDLQLQTARDRGPAIGAFAAVITATPVYRRPMLD